MKTIKYKFVAYAGSMFESDKKENVSFIEIADKWFKHNNRKGKIIHSGYTSVYEHGYSGGYDNYKFVYQDDLSSVDLNDDDIFTLMY